MDNYFNMFSGRKPSNPENVPFDEAADMNKAAQEADEAAQSCESVAATEGGTDFVSSESAAAEASTEEPAAEASAENPAGEAPEKDASVGIANTASEEKRSEPAGGADCGDISRAIERVEELNRSTDALNGKIAGLAEDVSDIKTLVARLAAYDTAVETLKRSLASVQKSEKNLYEEVEQYKKGTYFTNIKPFLMYIIEILCEMKKTREEYIDEREEFVEKNSEDGYNEIVELLGFFINSFESQLTIQGVSIINFEPETEYVPGKQRILKTVSTSEENKNGMVSNILSDCYMYGTTVLQPAKVYAYKKS